MLHFQNTSSSAKDVFPNMISTLKSCPKQPFKVKCKIVFYEGNNKTSFKSIHSKCDIFVIMLFQQLKHQMQVKKIATKLRWVAKNNNSLQLQTYKKILFISFSVLFSLKNISFLSFFSDLGNSQLVQDYKVTKLTLQSQSIDSRHLTKICLLLCHIR